MVFLRLCIHRWDSLSDDIFDSTLLWIKAIIQNIGCLNPPDYNRIWKGSQYVFRQNAKSWVILLLLLFLKNTLKITIKKLESPKRIGTNIPEGQSYFVFSCLPAESFIPSPALCFPALDAGNEIMDDSCGVLSVEYIPTGSMPVAYSFGLQAKTREGWILTSLPHVLFTNGEEKTSVVHLIFVAVQQVASLLSFLPNCTVHHRWFFMQLWLPFSMA